MTLEIDQKAPLSRQHLTVQEVAAELGVHWQTVYRWCKSGKCPVEKTPSGRYRIPKSWVDSQEWRK